MKKSKLISLFQTFSSDELREFALFVRSPIFNQRKDVVALFDVLRSAKNFEKLTPEKVYSKVCSGVPFDKKQMAHVMSYLMAVMEKYLVFKETDGGKEFHFHLAKAYRKRGLEKPFFLHIKKAEKELENRAIKNLSVHLFRYELALERYGWQKKQVRGEALGLQELADQLDVFLIGKKLQLGSMLLSNANLFRAEYQQGLLPKILEFIESEGQEHLFELPAIALHFHSLKTLRDDDESHFHELKKLLTEHASKFTKTELRDFYVIAINFGIKRLNRGQREFVKETFNLYRESLVDGVLLEDGVLSQFHYKNIAALGLGLREFNWVEVFLKKYKSYLESQNRENNFNYNLAKLHYERKEYGAAMRLLQAVKYEDVLPNLTAKILLMKIYFEQEEREVLESYLKNFESSVRRQKAIGYHRESYLNLAKLMRKTLMLNPFDREAKLALREQVETTQVLPEKQWLLIQLS